jgi:hypothetical protein
VKAIEAANSDFLRFLAKNAGYPVDPVPFREIGYFLSGKMKKLIYLLFFIQNLDASTTH